MIPDLFIEPVRLHAHDDDQREYDQTGHACYDHDVVLHFDTIHIAVIVLW